MIHYLVTAALVAATAHNAYRRIKMSASFDALKESITAAETSMTDATGLIGRLVAAIAAGPTGETVDPAEVASVKAGLDSAAAALASAVSSAG